MRIMKYCNYIQANAVSSAATHPNTDHQTLLNFTDRNMIVLSQLDRRIIIIIVIKMNRFRPNE